MRNRRDVPTHDDVRAEKARRRLREYVRQAWPVVEPSTPFIPGWHLDCICEHLEAVTYGEVTSLLINIPPRHAKSLSVSVFWPTWEWLTWPERRWLYTTYAEALAIRDALKSRRIIDSTWYQQRWGHLYQLTSDQNQKSRYENDRTGYRLATGVDGGNTGEGGDVIVSDDPHNVREAESDAVREGVLTWWDEVMSTRSNDPKRRKRVVVMQRVHGRDLSGHLLEKGGYHHLCLPAEYEPRVYVQPGEPEPRIQPHDDCPIATDPRKQDGELLWPERVGPAELAEYRRDLGSVGYAGQYQQRPVPRQGALFRAEWFQPLPPHFGTPGRYGPSWRQRLPRVQYWDLNYSSRDTADYTAAVTVAVDTSDPERRCYVTGLWRQHVAEEAQDVTLAQHILATRPHLVAVEETAFKQRATLDLLQRVQMHLSGRYAVRVVAVKVSTDKVMRAHVPAGRAEAGLLYFDKSLPLYPTFEAECLGFPRAAHDDFVDALSGAVALAIEVPAAEDERPVQARFGGRR